MSDKSKNFWNLQRTSKQKLTWEHVELWKKHNIVVTLNGSVDFVNSKESGVYFEELRKAKKKKVQSKYKKYNTSTKGKTRSSKYATGDKGKQNSKRKKMNQYAKKHASNKLTNVQKQLYHKSRKQVMNKLNENDLLPMGADDLKKVLNLKPYGSKATKNALELSNIFAIGVIELTHEESSEIGAAMRAGLSLEKCKKILAEALQTKYVDCAVLAKLTASNMEFGGFCLKDLLQKSRLDTFQMKNLSIFELSQLFGISVEKAGILIKMPVFLDVTDPVSLLRCHIGNWSRNYHTNPIQEFRDHGLPLPLPAPGTIGNKIIPWKQLQKFRRRPDAYRYKIGNKYIQNMLFTLMCYKAGLYTTEWRMFTKDPLNLESYNKFIPQQDECSEWDRQSLWRDMVAANEKLFDCWWDKMTEKKGFEVERAMFFNDAHGILSVAGGYFHRFDGHLNDDSLWVDMTKGRDWMRPHHDKKWVAALIRRIHTPFSRGTLMRANVLGIVGNPDPYNHAYKFEERSFFGVSDDESEDKDDDESDESDEEAVAKMKLHQVRYNELVTGNDGTDTYEKWSRRQFEKWRKKTQERRALWYGKDYSSGMNTENEDEMDYGDFESEEAGNEGKESEDIDDFHEFIKENAKMEIDDDDDADDIDI